MVKNNLPPSGNAQKAYTAVVHYRKKVEKKFNLHKKIKSLIDCL